ncbi:MAG: YigZ family protein [Eubacterium sp.]|nr:YigZ family protein [Eubacterium sp.]
MGGALVLNHYKVVWQGGSGEIIEKKSRFIATIEPVESEQEAAAFIGVMKKKYWDASHNCSAFTIGRNHELTRCSDDGEPSQTAGRPMLDVLLREDIHNVAVVVTRYFGGTLLGTGGLVRAYQKSTQAGLAQAVIIEKQQGRMLDIETDYNGLGKIQYLLAQHKIPVLDTEYTDKVVIHAMTPAEIGEQFAKEVTEGTSGAAELIWGKTAEFAVIAEQVKLFESES